MMFGINPHTDEWQAVEKMATEGAKEALEALIAVSDKDDYHRGRLEAFMEILKAGQGREPEITLSFPPNHD